MIKKMLVVSVLGILLLAGCAEKNVDPAKIQEATNLINNKNYEKGVALLDQLGKSSPNDEPFKKVQADGHVKYGNYFMYESTLPPKEKYPSALKQYRIAATLDPSNAEAKQNIGLIEGIYNQMGRTIPN